MKTTLGERFAVLGQLKAQVAAVEQTRDLDDFLAPEVDQLAAAEREVLDAATEWAAGTGPEAQVRLQEAVMRMRQARGGN